MAEEAQVEVAPRNRATDNGVLCQIALRASQVWDFIDKRQVDAHILTGLIVWGTYQVMAWATHFAEASTRSGTEVAAIIAAIMVPWGAVQGAALKFYFDARR
jgi:hypothetical protein